MLLTIELKNIPSEIPSHPFFVHFPVVFTLLLPFLIAFVLYAQKKEFFGEKSHTLWFSVVFVQILNIIFSYFSLYSGDIEYELLQHSPYLKQTIEQHKRFAESFFVFSIFLLAITALGLQNFSFHRLFRILSIPLSVVAIVLVFITGNLGGKITYKLDAPYYRHVLIEEYNKSKENRKDLPENQTR